MVLQNNAGVVASIRKGFSGENDNSYQRSNSRVHTVRKVTIPCSAYSAWMASFHSSCCGFSVTPAAWNFYPPSLDSLQLPAKLRTIWTWPSLSRIALVCIFHWGYDFVYVFRELSCMVFVPKGPLTFDAVKRLVLFYIPPCPAIFIL